MRIERSARFLAIAAVALLSACNPAAAPDKATPEAAPAPIEAPRVPYEWNVNPPNEVLAKGPMQLRLTSGAFAAFLGTKVAAGETISVSTTLTGPAGRNVWLAIQRHCNPERGEMDVTTQRFTLTGQSQAVEISHRFAGGFDCIKFVVIPDAQQQTDITIGDLQLRRQ